MTRRLAVLGAPSAMGIVPDEHGRPRRLDLAPRALRDRRLPERLGALDLGDAGPPQRYQDVERPLGRCRNEDDVAAYSRELAHRIARCRHDRQFVLLLGGDCSIVLGALLGLRAVDGTPPGLVYIDAHADFATLDESPSGSACSMALALAVGREDQPLSRLREGGPLTSGERVAHIGRREGGQPSYGASALEACAVLDLPMSAIRSSGASDVARKAVERVTEQSDGFWVHFDSDVLDPEALPATCDPAPGGIDFTQAADLLGSLVAHPAALGLQLTLYDPTLDAGGTGAGDLAGMLEHALAGS